MPIKKMLFADAEGNWWDYMSPEQQKKYITDHPNSIHAKDHLKKAEDKKTDDDVPSKPEHKTETDKKPATEHKSPESKDRAVEDKPTGDKKNVSPGSPPLTKKDSLAVRMRSMLSRKEVHPEDHKMFEEGGEKPGSKQRVKISHIVKKSSGRVIEHLKGQGSEWKHGMVAIKKLASGGTLSEHDKAGLKAMSKDILITVGSVVVTGGLGHGVALALGHLGYDLVKDSILKSLAHGVVGSVHRVPVLAMSSDEKLMEKIIHQLADFIAHGDIPDDTWEKTVADLAKKKSRQDNVHSTDKKK